MPLRGGDKIGPYEIVHQIGKGGMGEVYRAYDTKLCRDIAIKALPAELARNTDRVTRFQREARILAALNHPNIAAIYGLEECSGHSFLVLELVDGETLAHRIESGGPILIQDALRIAVEIAEALEAAHSSGVIHRDIKPGNIMLTARGHVKVLDFGLAT